MDLAGNHHQRGFHSVSDTSLTHDARYPDCHQLGPQTDRQTPRWGREGLLPNHSVRYKPVPLRKLLNKRVPRIYKTFLHVALSTLKHV